MKQIHKQLKRRGLIGLATALTVVASSAMAALAPAAWAATTVMDGWMVAERARQIEVPDAHEHVPSSWMVSDHDRRIAARDARYRVTDGWMVAERDRQSEAQNARDRISPIAASQQDESVAGKTSSPLPEDLLGGAALIATFLLGIGVTIFFRRRQRATVT